MGFLLYPYFLILFWYHDFLPRVVVGSFEVLKYAADLLSAPILLSNFFKPLKNEYREGLVGFSIAMGVVVKSAILIADLSLLAFVLAVLIFVDLLVAALPLALILLAV